MGAPGHRQVLAAIAAAALLGPAAAVAQQSSIQSANAMLEGCRAVVTATPTSHLSGDMGVRAGICMGKIEALGWAGALMIDDKYWSCRPPNATLEQATKVVLGYLDKNLARLHEDFDGLALEALAHAWPCRK